MEQSALSAVNSEPVKALMPVILRLTGMSLRAEKREILDRKAKESFILAQADSPDQAAELGRPSGFDSDYLRQRQQRNQQNREAIALKAVAQVSALPEGIRVETPDSDWLDHFSDACETVTDESIREMWARVLCLESTSVGSFSKRSIAALRMMDRREAETLEYIASWSVFADQSGMMVETQYVPSERINLHEEMLRRAEAIGLIAGARNSVSAIFNLPVDNEWVVASRFVAGGHIALLRRADARGRTFQHNGWPVSDLGFQLLNLPTAAVSDEFVSELLSNIRSLKLDAKFVPRTKEH